MLKLGEYLKIASAAKLLGISQNTLRSWADSGRITVHKNPINGYRLFLKKDLEEFLQSVESPVSSVKPR
jgi:excisionase family DNA binding protein